MGALPKDPMFFYAVAFGIFILLALRFGRKPLLEWLDNGILKIRNELDQATALRAEAETALADYKIRQAAAMSEADAIIRFAQDEAARLKAKAAADLKESLARQEAQATERIRLAEVEAMEAVRRAAVALALQMAEQTLKANLQNGQGDKLNDQALAEIPMLFDKSPAKAA